MDKINEAIIKRVTEVTGNLKNIQSIDIRIIGDIDNPLSIEYKVKESIVPDEDKIAPYEDREVKDNG
jgi:hypothetical protein